VALVGLLSCILCPRRLSGPLVAVLGFPKVSPGWLPEVRGVLGVLTWGGVSCGS
jgi:hypothetical protein